MIFLIRELQGNAKKFFQQKTNFSHKEKNSEWKCNRGKYQKSIERDEFLRIFLNNIHNLLL